MSVYLDRMGESLQDESLSHSPADQSAEEIPKTIAVQEGIKEILKECVELARLGGPVVLSYFSQLLVFQLALGYSGTLLGDTALAGASMGLMFSNCFGSSVIIGMANALDTLLFQVYGANPRSPLISVYVQRALLVLIMCCLPLSVLWVFAGEFLLLTGQQPEVVELAKVFIRWNLVNLFLGILYEVIRKLLTCIHNLNVVSLISITLTLLSPFLFKLFIGAFGIAGSVLTISVFYVIMISVCAFDLLIRYKQFAGLWHGPSRAALRHWKEFLALGLPSSLMLFLEWGLFELNGIASGRFGEKALDTMSICMQLLTVIYMVPLGLNVALCLRVGGAFGAKDLRGARRTVFAAGLVIACVITVDALLIWATRYQVPLFFTKNAEIQQRYADVVPLIIFFHIFDAILCVCNGIIKGMGYPLYGTAFLALAYLFGVPVGWTLAFHRGMEVRGLWTGPAIGLCLAVCAYITFFLKLDWNGVIRKATARIAHNSTALDKKKAKSPEAL
ncbi:multidrug and toxin extrusion protein 1-like protein [Perkinsela sp. CCAP 1560/4]|nr:multidrug and toxin extrusion protein 1-like protein [Perkinsela sp. CCAP 1560/4]|eukprot:KNH07484.1 multidrug and toxin extrusion protein 1-like protein [Perkinsela sp. CCAP 1560/4]